MSTPERDGAPVEDGRGDRELIAAHLDGDGAAFSEIARRHRRRLWNVAVRMLRNHEDAADAVQEAFISALRGAAGYRGEAEVATWLSRITVNLCLTKIAARKRQVAVAVLDEHSPDESGLLAEPRDLFAELDARRHVAALLAQLPEEQRLVVVLVDVEGYSLSETADKLGVAVGTVKSRCARGRARLAAALLREGITGSNVVRRAGGAR